jgi:hypothetical protein
VFSSPVEADSFSKEIGEVEHILLAKEVLEDASFLVRGLVVVDQEL